MKNRVDGRVYTYRVAIVSRVGYIGTRYVYDVDLIRFDGKRLWNYVGSL